MDVIMWLEKNANGFCYLPPQERSAPMHFSLLWSYFEARAFGKNCSAEVIAAWVRDLSRRDKLDTRFFAYALAYFRNRYYSKNGFTPRFKELYLRRNDKPRLVEEVISGENGDSVDGVIALFIVFYRFRNNYFHGLKWADSLHGQFENFTIANQSIMAIIEMAGP